MAIIFPVCCMVFPCRISFSIASTSPLTNTCSIDCPYALHTPCWSTIIKCHTKNIVLMTLTFMCSKVDGENRHRSYLIVNGAVIHTQTIQFGTSYIKSNSAIFLNFYHRQQLGSTYFFWQGLIFSPSWRNDTIILRFCFNTEK